MFVFTEQQRKNLETLAAHLEKRPNLLRRYRIKFSMRNWAKNPKVHAWKELSPKQLIDMANSFKGACGTAVCAMGEAALIFPKEALESQSGFWSLGYDLFGLNQHSAEWIWIFESEWEGVDNSREGAAQRIRWLLANGLPEDHIAQRYGEAPLCYKAKK